MIDGKQQPAQRENPAGFDKCVCVCVCADSSVSLRDLNTFPYMQLQTGGGEVCRGDIPDRNTTQEQNSQSWMWLRFSFQAGKGMFFFQDMLVGRGGLHTHTGAGEKASFPPCGWVGAPESC